MNQVVQTPEQQYYLSKLLRYDYIISYKPGNTNKVADTLSRRDSSSKSQILILCVPIYDFLIKYWLKMRFFLTMTFSDILIIILFLNALTVLYITRANQF